ncbi:hypothetical protein MKZ38_000584 [Zalerion maritima]|uniref:Uncharacterized protein n=1 Tax=Zalerion maritima TaxID=339359 RepID=A0AAD5RSF8_9PEZI|nr:hypothetical protein MKZ38_000584 [Zalerion maritima]
MRLLANTTLVALLSTAVRESAAEQQIPLNIPNTNANESPSSTPRFQPTLNFTSPSPHLFSSISTLLQQAPNTIFPSGYSLAPVLIPPYTLFYHGRRDPLPSPPSPEWLSFDIEMAYGIMGSSRSSFMLTFQTTRPVSLLYFDGMSAALMGLGGQMDSQMLALFGNVTGPPWGENDGRGGFGGLWQEYLRAHGLCDWLEESGLRGKGWGVEGVVRMNAGFEVIWCDFSSGSLRVVDHRNVTAPTMPEGPGEGGGDGGGDGNDARGEEEHDWDVQTALEYSLPPLPEQPTTTSESTDPTDPPRPPNWERDGSLEPFRTAQAWGWFLSATYHYGSMRSSTGMGETRAKVQSCGVISWYSPRLDGENASLSRAIEEKKRLNLTTDGIWKGSGSADDNMAEQLKELGRRRRFHQLEFATEGEAMYLRHRSETALRELLNGGEKCSGVDWVLMMREIVQRTVQQVKVLESHLDKFPRHKANETMVKTWLHGLRAQSHMFLMPYFEYPLEYTPETWRTDSKLFNETYSRCRFRYTRLLAEDQGIVLSDEEKDLKGAVEDVYGSVCQVVLSVGFEAEGYWVGMFDKESQKQGGARSPAHTKEELLEISHIWGMKISELIAWLGWENEYIGCKEACAWDERCYIPMWPLIHWDGNRRRPGGPPRNGDGPPPDGGHDHGPPPPENLLLARSRENDAPRHGSPPGPPGRMPTRGSGWMDDTDLWEPKCVKASYIMGDA